MISWVKAVHIAALIVWCSGLLMLPTLYTRRDGMTEPALTDLRRQSRALFVFVTSPAACLTIIAGTVLIFLQGAFTAWMALKLLAVGLLVMIHVRQGFVILRLFKPGRRYARWRQALTTGATIAVISLILWSVLAKPRIDPGLFPAVMRQPGGLQSVFEIMMPTP